MSEVLRPHLKLEISAHEKEFEQSSRDICSFVNELTQNNAETRILCVDPMQTAADKFSALVWRINAKDRKKPRGSTQNDPTIMRHLHDLVALRGYVSDHRFKSICEDSLKKDMGRSDITDSIDDHIKKSLSTLITDKIYSKEYEAFVETVSYEKKDKRILFKEACKEFEKICFTMIENK